MNAGAKKPLLARLKAAAKSKLTWVSLGVAAVLILALVAFPHPRCYLWGTVRGESFYRGMPASYWAECVKQLEQRPPSPWDWLLSRIGFRQSRPEGLHRLLRGEEGSALVLIELLRHEDQMVRHWSMCALANIGFEARFNPERLPHQQEMLAALERLYRDGTSRDRQNVLHALGHMGANATPRLPLIEEALSSPDPEVQLQAAVAICSINPYRHDALKIIIANLQSPKQRDQAVMGLAAIVRTDPKAGRRFLQGHAAEFKPLLLTMAADAEPTLRMRSQAVLELVFPAEETSDGRPNRDPE